MPEIGVHPILCCTRAVAHACVCLQRCAQVADVFGLALPLGLAVIWLVSFVWAVLAVLSRYIGVRVRGGCGWPMVAVPFVGPVTISNTCCWPLCGFLGQLVCNLIAKHTGVSFDLDECC